MNAAVMLAAVVYPFDPAGLEGRRTEGQENLQSIADGTGGFATISTNDYARGVDRMSLAKTAVMTPASIDTLIAAPRPARSLMARSRSAPWRRESTV